MQCTPCKKRQKSVKSKSPTNRKAPSPQKEYKILSRRSSSNLARNLQKDFNERSSPTRHSPSVNNRLSNDDYLQALETSTEKLNATTYAGARFHSPPSPNSLPKPPTHWLNATCAASVSPMLNAPFLDSMAVHLKGLLNVQA